MILRIPFSFPLPICVLFCVTASLIGQEPDDPFKAFGQDTEDPFNPFGQAQPVTERELPKARTKSGKATDDEKIKAFNSEMTRVQNEYAQMVLREKALTDMIRRLTTENKVNELAKQEDVKAALRERFRAWQAQQRSLENSLATIAHENQILKTAIDELQNSKSQADAAAEKAVNQRNEMHQALFENLLNSVDVAQQELALVHLFACADKYEQGKEFPIDIYKPDLLRRVSVLTDSESEKVKQLASKCMFGFTPHMAAEIGIQFAPVWRPLEFYRSSTNTQRIFSALEQQCNAQYDETPIDEVLEEMQMHYRIPVRMQADADGDVTVTFESQERSLANTLSGLLSKYKLGYVVIDEQIVVMSQTNPDLNVNRTYNVRGLMDDKVSIQKVVDVIEQSAGSEKVKTTSVNDHVLMVKTTEANHRRIQKQLGTMASQAKWYAK